MAIEIPKMLEAAILKEAASLRMRKLQNAIWALGQVIKLGSSTELTMSYQKFKNEYTVMEQGMVDTEKLEVEISEVINGMMRGATRDIDTYCEAAPLLEMKIEEIKSEEAI